MQQCDGEIGSVDVRRCGGLCQRMKTCIGDWDWGMGVGRNKRMRGKRTSKLASPRAEGERYLDEAGRKS